MHFVGVANRPAPQAHPAARHLIPRVCHLDPLGWPVCHNPMCVIAVIDDPRAVEKILRRLVVWYDPTPRPPPHGSRTGFRDGDANGADKRLQSEAKMLGCHWSHPSLLAQVMRKPNRWYNQDMI